MCLGGVRGGCGRGRRRGADLGTAGKRMPSHNLPARVCILAWGLCRGHPMSTPCCRCCPVLGHSQGLAVLLLAALPLVTRWAPCSG